MRFAIVESGGKQYRAVEGSTIEVDRLPVEPGRKIDLERVLLMADGDEVLVGTPTVGGIHVKATVVDHFQGPKVVRFRYRPKKRIRVKGGYRHQYTRLLIDFIGRAGEERRAKKAAEVQAEEAEAVKVPEAVKQDKGPAKEAEKKPAKKVEKASLKKTAGKPSSKSKTEKK